MLKFNNEDERLEYNRMKNREKQARYYKKNKKKLFAKQKEKRHQIKIETLGTDDLRGNILLRLYSHPNNTYSKTELQRMSKLELITLEKRLDGDK